MRTDRPDIERMRDRQVPTPILIKQFELWGTNQGESRQELQSGRIMFDSDGAASGIGLFLKHQKRSDEPTATKSPRAP